MGLAAMALRLPPGPARGAAPPRTHAPRRPPHRRPGVRDDRRQRARADRATRPATGSRTGGVRGPTSSSSSRSTKRSALDAAHPAGAEVSSVVRSRLGPDRERRRDRDRRRRHRGSRCSGSPSRSITVTDGRQPQPGEVWLSRPLADRLGVEVGDAVTLDPPGGNVDGRRNRSRRDSTSTSWSMILPDLPVEQFVDGVLDRVTLIDLPADASAADIAAAGRGLGEIVVESPLDDSRLRPACVLARAGRAVRIRTGSAGLGLGRRRHRPGGDRHHHLRGIRHQRPAPTRDGRAAVRQRGAGAVGSPLAGAAGRLDRARRLGARRRRGRRRPPARQVDDRGGQGVRARAVPLRPVRPHRDRRHRDRGGNDSPPSCRPVRQVGCRCSPPLPAGDRSASCPAVSSRSAWRRLPSACSCCSSGPAATGAAMPPPRPPCSAGSWCSPGCAAAARWRSTR